MRPAGAFLPGGWKSLRHVGFYGVEWRVDARRADAGDHVKQLDRELHEVRLVCSHLLLAGRAAGRTVPRDREVDRAVVRSSPRRGVHVHSGITVACSSISDHPTETCPVPPPWTRMTGVIPRRPQAGLFSGSSASLATRSSNATDAKHVGAIGRLETRHGHGTECPCGCGK